MSSIPDCEWPDDDNEEHNFTELAKLMSAAVDINSATEQKAPIVETKVSVEQKAPTMETKIATEIQIHLAAIKFGRRKVLTSR
jgi:hypothetical protein